jgi:hypothetical protein
MKKMFRRFLPCLTLMCLAAALAGATATSRAASPTLSFTNLKAGQKLTNGVFTVNLKAAGAAGISNVLYSLNTAAWTNADGGSNDWLAQVTLVPGNNTISAYAVDNSGHSSRTVTVKFIYFVTGTLTVLTNGDGTIKPDYNGQLLQLGSSYTMTARSPVRGFGLQSWTDASNNVISTSSTLKFIMTSNLTLIANFGDVTRPMMILKNLTTNSDGVPSDFYVNGIASDNVGVSSVFFKLTTTTATPTTWLTATSTNNWTNWSAAVTLSPGLNYFYAYAVDGSSNSSQMIKAQITYNSAPKSLSGQIATATDASGNSLFSIAFGKNTFSLASPDVSEINGAGSYTYLNYGSGANLKLNYVVPPSTKTIKTGKTLGISFSSPSQASFNRTKVITTNLVVLATNNLVITTNLVSTNMTVLETGNLQLLPASNLAFASAFGQAIWAAGSQTNANGLVFQKTAYTSLALLSADTNAGTYTYTQYSPVGSLFKLTDTNGTAYMIATFGDTNYGSYYEEDYTRSGKTNGADKGHFVVASGNHAAPPSLTNLDLHIFTGDGDFNEQFGPDTYSQTSLTTNYDNDVGSYTYTNPDANIGQLDLTIIAPPADATNNVLAGNESAARLIFVGDNVGLFTNGDGTVSTFATSLVTNLVPASIATNTLNSIFFFDTNGNFTFYGTTSGTYSYQPFSPTVAMIQFNFITNGVGTNSTELDWLQLNFTTTTNSGTYFDSQFDTETNFLRNIRNTFYLQ